MIGNTRIAYTSFVAKKKAPKGLYAVILGKITPNCLSYTLSDAKSFYG